MTCDHQWKNVNPTMTRCARCGLLVVVATIDMTAPSPPSYRVPFVLADDFEITVDTVDDVETDIESAMKSLRN